ncbi:hypothetical protein BT93_G1865 [Corymbia citriodora subsp. variegata]|nr:hypothetical protein BT93_G1865 [Corymbia citriodora subsp. variegata]
MESRTFSSGSNSFHRSEGEGNPRRTSWIRMNPRRRFYECVRYREGSKCKYNAKFSNRVIKVILDLLDGQHQHPSIFMDDLDDIDSMQASSANYLRNEVSRMKIKQKCYQAFIVVLFCCLAYYMMKYKALEVNKKFLRLPCKMSGQM